MRTTDLEFGLFEAGSALYLHGFPETAHTWVRLLPSWPGPGSTRWPPFMRGYAPSTVPADGAYHLGTLAVGAVALHKVLGGGGDVVLIGHDWGAEAAYAAADHVRAGGGAWLPSLCHPPPWTAAVQRL